MCLRHCGLSEFHDLLRRNLTLAIALRGTYNSSSDMCLWFGVGWGCAGGGGGVRLHFIQALSFLLKWAGAATAQQMKRKIATD